MLKLMPVEEYRELSWREREDYATNVLLENVPYITVDEVRAIKGKPFRQIATLGPFSVPLIAVYDKSIKKTKLFLVSEEFIFRAGKNDYNYSKIVLEDYGEKKIILDYDQTDKIRLYNGDYEKKHEVWIREDEEVFRIAKMKSVTNLYARASEDFQYSFYDIGNGVEVGLDIFVNPQDYHLAVKSQLESAILEKDTVFFKVRTHFKSIRMSHMNANHTSSVFYDIPKFFLKRIYDFMLTKVDASLLKDIEYIDDKEKEVQFSPNGQGISNLIRFYHYPNMFHMDTRYDVVDPHWTPTVRRKSYMKPHEWVKYFYPVLGNKTAKRIASKFDLRNTTYRYGDDSASFFLSQMDQHAIQHYTSLFDISNDFPLTNRLQAYDYNISFRSFARFLKNNDIYDILVRRYRNMVFNSEVFQSEFGTTYRQDTSAPEEKPSFQQGHRIFADTLQMLVRVYCAHNFEDTQEPLLAQLDLAGLLQHAQTETDIHDVLVREMNRIREIERLEQIEASKFDLEYNEKAQSLTAVHDDFVFHLPETSEDIQTIGNDMNICVGWGYPEGVRDGNLLIVEVQDESGDSILCIELDKTYKSVTQAKLKHNRIMEYDSPIHRAVMAWIDQHDLKIKTRDIATQAPVVAEPNPAPIDLFDDNDIQDDDLPWDVDFDRPNPLPQPLQEVAGAMPVGADDNPFAIDNNGSHNGINPFA